MQQSAIFSILLILLNRRKVSRDYLAERFSVSKRTISRYLAVLEDAGVPIVSVPGVNGGVALAGDYSLDKTFLTEAEISRIMSALDLSSDAFNDNVNASLAEKLKNVNRVRAQENYTVNQDNLYIDCDSEQAATLRPKIKAIDKAISDCRVVDMKYTDASGAVSYRTVEPYTLVFKAGAWYMYAMCKLRGDFRLFKLSRISDLRVTSRSFAKQESKLAEKLDLEFYNEVYIDLEFEFSPMSDVRESITDWLGESAITERGTKLVASVELPLSNHLYKRLLSYGSSIKILHPQDLAERLRDEAKNMAELYE